MDAFFKFENGDVTFNEGVVMNIPVIKKIISSDRGGVITGDSEGRKKLFAKRQLTYVWYIVNANSPGVKAGYSGADLAEYSKARLDMPKGWKPSEHLQEFILMYRKYHETNVVKTIKQIREAFSIIYDSNSIMINHIKTQLKKSELSVDDILALNKAQKEIISVSIDIPKLTKELHDAELAYNAQTTNFGKQLGGKPIQSSMIPNSNS